jgi:hypothetical protein
MALFTGRAAHARGQKAAILSQKIVFAKSGQYSQSRRGDQASWECLAETYTTTIAF